MCIYLLKFTFSHSNLSFLRKILSKKKKTTVKGMVLSTFWDICPFSLSGYKITWMIKMFVKNSAEPTVKNIQTGKRFIYSGRKSHSD